MNASPLAYSIAEACEVSGISRTSVYEAINARELIARKHGRRTVILADELRRWLQSLPITTPKAPSKSSVTSGAQPADTVAA
jgi:excisionase family DNA binding protein